MRVGVVAVGLVFQLLAGAVFFSTGTGTHGLMGALGGR